MATIEPRKTADGTVTYRTKVRLKGFPEECATFKRKSDAVQWARSIEASMIEGRYGQTSEAKRHTFSELAQRYRSEVVPLRPKNAANTLRHLNYWDQKLGPLKLSDITASLLVQYRNELSVGMTHRGSQRSGATVVRYLATLSHAFTIAIKEWQWLNDNPVRKISKPMQSRGRERFLSEAERQSLLHACKESSCPYLLPVVMLAITSGMRRGEIMNLRWKDIDFRRDTILLTQTKNGSSRSLSLSKHVKPLIQGLRQSNQAASEVIFSSKATGRPMDIERHWQTALAKAEIKNFRFHDLRHTTASYLAMNGATTMQIAAVLGHKTLQMVKRYSHLTDTHTAGVLESMNDKVFNSQNL